VAAHGGLRIGLERVMQAKLSISAAVCVIALSLAQTFATPAHSEQTGTSTADSSSGNKAAFSLANDTGITMNYQVKWGNNQWKSFTLENGRIYTHSYALNNNGEFLSPSVRFDRIGGDSSYTEKVYDMDVTQVGSGGFGGHRSEPKKYYFEFSADNRHLNIYAK
jgi:hypothetical protein